MIKVNDEFSMYRDPYQWILVQKYEGKDKKGKAKMFEKKTYHANFEQVSRAIIEKSSKKCDSLDGLRELYTNGVKAFVSGLEKIELKK